MKISYFFFFTLFSLLSCKKINENSSKTIVKGNVKNKLTNQVLANMPVEIIGCDYMGKCINHLQKTNTDINGNYEMEVMEAKGYYRKKVILASNDVIASTPYPYDNNIVQANKVNTFNFSEKPIRNLKIRVKVTRHDKNWLQVEIADNDTDGFYSKSIFTNFNPSYNLDTTCVYKIIAGRKYKVNVILADRLGDNYQNIEYLAYPFDVIDVDSTNFNVTVQ